MGIGRFLLVAKNYLLVLPSGVISSAAVLLILWAMAEYWPGVYLIGWYCAMIPVGAIGAGIAAVSGYLLAAYWTGAAIPRAIFLPIFILQLAVYTGAEYVEYRREVVRDPEMSSISFFTYYDLRSRSFSLVHHLEQEEPVKGYMLRSLEMGGFAGPAFLVPLFMNRIPRCRRCKGYESTRMFKPLVFVPEAAFSQWRTLRSFQQGDEAGWDTREGYFRDEVMDLLRPLIDAIEQGEPQAMRDALRQLRQQSDAVSAAHCVITPCLQYCSTCMAGKLMVSFRFKNGSAMRIGLLPGIAVDEVAIEALRA